MSRVGIRADPSGHRARVLGEETQMRIPWMWAASLLAACAPPPKVAEALERLPRALAAAPETECNLVTEMSNLQLEAPDLRGRQLDIGRDDRLLVRIWHGAQDPGAATLSVTVGTQHGRTTTMVVDDVLQGGEVRDVLVPVAALDLPDEELQVSGGLVFHGAAHYEDGGTEYLEGDTSLHFHPTGAGWVVYDRAVQDREFSRGALSAEAKTRVGVTRATEEPGYFLDEPSFSLGRKLSAERAWRPMLDGEADDAQ